MEEFCAIRHSETSVTTDVFLLLAHNFRFLSQSLRRLCASTCLRKIVFLLMCLADANGGRSVAGQGRRTTHPPLTAKPHRTSKTLVCAAHPKPKPYPNIKKTIIQLP